MSRSATYFGPVTQDQLNADRAALNMRWSELDYYDNRTLYQVLTHGVAKYGDTRSVFHADGNERICTNRQLQDAALRVARALRSSGIGPGDVIAVQLPAWYETALLFRAVACVGAVVLPILPVFGLSETRFVLEQSRARLIFMPAQLRSTDYRERAEQLKAIPSLRSIIHVGSRAATESGWDAFIARGDAGQRIEPPRVAPDDVALVLFTSGTTAAPKGVQHTHNTLLREWSRPAYQLEGQFLSVLPAGHYTGYQYLLRPSTHGVATIYMDQWVPDVAARLIERHRIEHSGGTPFFLIALLEAAKRLNADLGALKSFVMGGQSMTPQLIAKADAAGFPACRVYGLTEFPTVTELDASAPFACRSGTDGRADEGNEIRIVDDDGCEVTAGHEGEIIARGPELFVGYLDATLDRDCFLPGGWFRTGDIGKLDARGYLTITDRKKDIIIRGGENISSAEVEGVLMQHPSVGEVAVVAMPDSLYGERACAFVVLRDAATLTLADVRAHFDAAGVSRQKAPERLELVATLPRNLSGKVLKFKLREAARTFSREARGCTTR